MVCPHSAWVSAAGSAQGRLSVPRRSAPRALPLLPIPTPVPLASRMLSFPGAGSSLIWPPSSSFLQVGHSHLSGRPSQTPTKFLSSPPVGLKRWRALFIHVCTLRVSSGASLVVRGGESTCSAGMWVQSLVGEPGPQRHGASQPSCRSC